MYKQITTKCTPHAQRPAEDQIGPEDVADGTPDEPSGFSQADSGASPSSPPPMTSSASPSPSATVSSLNSGGGGGGGGIVFRPSLLQSAAQGFAFKQSSLNPIVASKFGELSVALSLYDVSVCVGTRPFPYNILLPWLLQQERVW